MEEENYILSRPVDFAELKDYLFSPANVFLTYSSGKKTKLIKASGVINEEYLKKFNSSKKRIEIETIANISNVEQFNELFKIYQNAKTEREKIIGRNSILTLFSSIYWKGANGGSLLDLVISCEKSFLKFDMDAIEELRNFGEDFFIRSSLMASLGLVLCMSLGYLDKIFLEDVYHLFFVLDYGLNNNISYNITEALKKDRLQVGAGKSFLSSNSNRIEMSLFNKHPLLGVKKSLNKFAVFFNQKDILNFIKIHHERICGQGFPMGIGQDEMNDLEQVIVFLSHLVPIKEYDFSRTDGQGYLKETCEKLEDRNNILGKSIENILLNIFENMPTWDEYIGKEIA